MIIASILTIALLVGGGRLTSHGHGAEDPPTKSTSDLTPEMRGVILQLLDATNDTIATDIIEGAMDELCTMAAWCRTDSIADCDTNLIGTTDRDSLGCDSVGTNRWLRFFSQSRYAIHTNANAVDDRIVVQLTQYPWGGDHSELFLRDGVNGQTTVPIGRRVGDAGSFNEVYLYRSCKTIDTIKLCTVYRAENNYEGDSLTSSDLKVMFVYAP